MRNIFAIGCMLAALAGAAGAQNVKEVESPVFSDAFLRARFDEMAARGPAPRKSASSRFSSASTRPHAGPPDLVRISSWP